MGTFKKSQNGVEVLVEKQCFRMNFAEISATQIMFRLCEVFTIAKSNELCGDLSYTISEAVFRRGVFSNG